LPSGSRRKEEAVRRFGRAGEDDEPKEDVVSPVVVEGSGTAAVAGGAVVGGNFDPLLSGAGLAGRANLRTGDVAELDEDGPATGASVAQDEDGYAGAVAAAEPVEDEPPRAEVTPDGVGDRDTLLAIVTGAFLTAANILRARGWNRLAVSRSACRTSPSELELEASG
jgi:hypothetical protein